MRLRALIAVGSLLALAGLPAIVQAESDKTPTRLMASEPGRGAKGHLTLRATLVTTEGKALGERQVTFFEQVTVFGPRDALLGTATTDSTGYAAIDYQPAELGSQRIVVRFNGDEQYAPSLANSSIDVREVVPIYPPAPLPLASVRQWLPLGLASLVLGTWAVLLGVTLRTVLGVRAAGRRRASDSVSARMAPEGTSS
jgi:hypothetical protein